MIWLYNIFEVKLAEENSWNYKRGYSNNRVKKNYFVYYCVYHYLRLLCVKHYYFWHNCYAFSHSRFNIFSHKENFTKHNLTWRKNWYVLLFFMCAAHIKYKNRLYNNMAFQILYDKATLKSQREMREVVVVGDQQNTTVIFIMWFGHA